MATPPRASMSCRMASLSSPRSARWARACDPSAATSRNLAADPARAHRSGRSRIQSPVRDGDPSAGDIASGRSRSQRALRRPIPRQSSNRGSHWPPFQGRTLITSQPERASASSTRPKRRVAIAWSIVLAHFHEMIAKPIPAPSASELKVVDATLAPYSMRFKGGKVYRSSVTTMQSVDHRMLRLALDDGSTTEGEVARYPLYNTDETERLEDATLLELRSVSFRRVPGILQKWRSREPELRGVAFALDCAWHRLISQRAGLPVSSLLGGPAYGVVPEVLSLSAGPQDELIRQIRADGGATRVIQIKLGVGALTDELSTVRRILRILDKEQLLLADFNGSLSQDAALSALPSVTDPKLLWEEPCKSLDANIVVAKALNGQMMFDTCLTDLAAYIQAISAGAKYVAIKPALMGGLAIARTARDLCIARGVKIRIDGPWSGQVAAGAALSLAIAVPADQIVGSIDLTQALETGNDQILKPALGWVGIDQMHLDPK